MLPFLVKQKMQEGTAQIVRPSDFEDKESDGAGIKAAAKDLLEAIEMKDLNRIASALKAAFEILDSEEHEEGPHLESEQE